MREKDLEEVNKLISQRDKINGILKACEHGKEWIAGYTTDADSQTQVMIRVKSDHPLFHQLLEMSKEHWLQQYRAVVARLKELGLQ